jgi:RNA recognition motif. (a.k.a. RRM, RBD, or RNP domain)
MSDITVCADIASFAFVEYESRRDADDAYHEMHNKRIGRDDLLKIEVC